MGKERQRQAYVFLWAVPVTRVFDGVLVHALRRSSLAQLLDGERLELLLEHSRRLPIYKNLRCRLFQLAVGPGLRFQTC